MYRFTKVLRPAYTNLHRPLAQTSLQRLTMSASPHLAADAPKAAETDTQAEAVTNATGVTSEGLQSTLRDKVGAQYVDIEDMSGSWPHAPHLR